MHFNPRAFTMAQPLSATVGNFGNVRDGILRQPSFSNWDLTPKLAASRFEFAKPAGAKQIDFRAEAAENAQ